MCSLVTDVRSCSPRLDLDQRPALTCSRARRAQSALRRRCVPTQRLDCTQERPHRFRRILAGPQLDPGALVGFNLDGCCAAVDCERVHRLGSSTWCSCRVGRTRFRASSRTPRSPSPRTQDRSGPDHRRVLFGVVNPSGKLPCSMPRHGGQPSVYHHQKSGSGYPYGPPVRMVIVAPTRTRLRSRAKSSKGMGTISLLRPRRIPSRRPARQANVGAMSGPDRPSAHGQHDIAQ